MKKVLKSIIGGAFSFFACVNLLAGTAEEKASPLPAQKELLVWLAIESPPGIWEKGYGKAFPAEYNFRSITEAGFTDVQLSAHADRGPVDFYHNTKIQNARRCYRMCDREWLEEALTAADKYNLKIWLVVTPDYKVKGTDIAGLNDPRHIKIWTDIIEEYGKIYKPRHKSIAGIFLHELDCAEAPDMHSDDLEEFSAFCLKNFSEKYTGDKIPTGKDGTKWDKRFCLYKNDIMTNFVKIMRDLAAKYDMKTAFAYYSPEMFSGDSSAWGYDTIAIEKIVDRMWVSIEAEYRDLRGSMVDTGPSYKGANVPYKETMAFHGKPINIFESRFILFPDVLRKSYRLNKKFTEIYGDYLNGYSQKSEKVIELFTGIENVKKWNNLQKEWIGSQSQSKIAMMAASTPIVLRFPSAPGVEYKKIFTTLMDDLKKRYSVDAQLIGSEFTLKPENLAKYELIIIPEEMGIGMDEDFLKNLKNYIAGGGKLLTIGTPITTGGRDLEAQTDHMEELFGIKIKSGKPLPGYVMLESKKLAVSDKKVWNSIRDIDVTTADEIIISDKITKKPVMTRKGNAYYLASDYNRDNDKTIVDLIDKIAPQPARLNGNDNFRFSSIVKNGNMLCIALPCEKAASATLSIDAENLGIKGDRFEIKNIITGKTLYNVSAGELKKGVKVKTDYDSEPYVLAIGAGDELAHFKGLYPDNKVFADMGKINVVENPEVAIALPDKPGIKVGIYQNAYGAEEIYKQLDKMSEFNCFYLPRLDAACMGHADVIIIPQAKSTVFFENAINVIKEMVRNGRGLILTHDVAVKSNKMFPDILKESNGKIMKVKDNSIKIQTELPAMSGVRPGGEYIPGFAYDHYAFAPGKDAQVIARDSKGNNVVLAGKFEKGKVVLFGTLPGEFSDWNNPAASLKDKKLEGRELQILADSVKWLAADKK